jgi:hypothetical protein
MGLDNKFKETKKNMTDFNEQMKLIKQFPIKGQYIQVKCLPYDIEKPISYPQSLFWN